MLKPLLLGAIAILLAVAGAAWADEGVPASTSDEDSYRRAAKLVQQAKERRAAADPRGALELYRQAHEAFPSPLLFWPMAELCLEAGQPREGLSALRQHRDGIPVKDYPPGQGVVEIAALEQKLSAQLARRVVVPPPAAQVAAKKDLPAARPAPHPMRRSFWSRHRLSIGLGGLSVALAVAGVGIGIATWRGYADLTPTCAGGPSGCPPDAVASIRDKALATNVLFGLAGGAALVAGGVFLLGERAPRATPTVTIGPGHAGASLLVRF